MDIKEEIKDFSSQNEGEFFMEDPVKVKVETVTNSSYIKPELEGSTCSQNEEHYLLSINETLNESDTETKIDIKEEDWWSEREGSCINDNVKDETNEDFYSKKPKRCSKEVVSSCTSDLLSGEDSGNDLCCNMIKESPEYQSDRRCDRQETVVIDISSIEINVCSGTSHNRKFKNMFFPSEQRKSLEQSNTNKEGINEENCKSVLSDEYRKSYECDVSEKCFKYPSQLEQPRLVHDCKEANKYTIQKKDLNQLSTVKTHKLIDDAKRTHECNVCNKAFITLSRLKQHKFIHEGIKPHMCNVCNKAFSHSSDLKKHKLIHDGVKPHKCNICNKAFTESPTLKKHKLIHEGIKPHKCNICNKAFTESTTLKKHKLIHEGIKPYKCNICNKAFTWLSVLINHKLIHDVIKSHICDMCKKAFTRLSSLKRHKLIHRNTPV